jgi:hypothetical protein
MKPGSRRAFFIHFTTKSGIIPLCGEILGRLLMVFVFLQSPPETGMAEY